MDSKTATPPGPGARAPQLMRTPRDRNECVFMLLRSSSAAEQLRLRSFVKDEPDFYNIIFHVCIRNPFFRLLDDEVAYIKSGKVPEALSGLLTARDTAARSTSPKYIVFCMPKSGSSFVQSALQHALQLPFQFVTGLVAPPVGSYFGMNSREQELDELALVTLSIASPRGFISQSHTRCSLFLARQLDHYGVVPLVTIRNVFDCIVSFDDMLMEWRATSRTPKWRADPQFALPLSYQELDAAARYEILAPTFGSWLINFFLSWKRCCEQGAVSPIQLRYEDHVLDPQRLVEAVSDRIPMTPEQTSRLIEYARSPDREKSRLNVGIAGRGRDKLPDHIKASLARYAEAFRDEITDEELDYLVH